MVRKKKSSKIINWKYPPKECRFAVGTFLKKEFDAGWFEGRVVSTTTSYTHEGSQFLYQILYQDGDGEDLLHQELEPWVVQEDGPILDASQTQAWADEVRLKSKFVNHNDKVDNEEEEVMVELPQEPDESKQSTKRPKDDGTSKDSPPLKKRAAVLEESPSENQDSNLPPSNKKHTLIKGWSFLNGTPKEANKKRTKSGRTTKAVTYKDDDSDSDDEFLESDEESIPKPQTKKQKTKKVVDSESEDDYEDMQEEEESEEEEELLLEDSEEEEAVAPLSRSTKKKASTKKQQKQKATPASSSSRKAAPPSSNKNDLQAELHAKLQKDRGMFKPTNNPQKLPPDQYVDPVGVDPTHGIVESIVAAQVSKVGGLLSLIKHKGDSSATPGELTYPLQLQTACSGTDAPSIALGLIQESLDKLAGNHNFKYTHEMSCELEPFKQSYIGRNFPGVLLFPDITKLTASAKVEDVYGRPQSLPDGNFFVAGTSCKDFSMLKTRDRKDIEDKGTSGETFLAAVEFLESQQPPCAIFENVDNAPWSKMQEYITGRIVLAERNTTKAIKDSKKKADADNWLKFSVNENGEYVAEEVPRQVGIRAGSVIEGFVQQGDDAHDVTPLHDRSKQKGLVTLKQLAKKHGIHLERDTLVMRKKARYCTRLVKLDTKNFGLPQTRNRKYLFIWRSEDPEDDLGDYFQEILDHLKTPLLHSMDAFLLPDSHDRIRCFREALRSGPGLMVKRERAKELDFWDWELAHVKDLTLHMVFREKIGVEERSRWLTQWDTCGRKALAPGLWPELFDCWNMRRLDMVDCFAAAAVRDAISRDPLHHSFTWDLSQNVTRAPFRSATVGVCGCVTPGGEILLPRLGRTLMGYEKLLLQGIPFSRLLLGPETEVQLSDLAGNAMSVTVISATMLAAMCAPQLKRQRSTNGKALLANFALSQKYDAAGGAVLAKRGDLYNVERDADAKAFAEVFGAIAEELANDAFRSSALCTCESSGTTSSDNILECTGCGFGICHGCSGRHQTASHDLKEIEVDLKEIEGSGEKERPDSHVFERKLRCAVPSVLRLGEGWEDCLEHGDGLEAYSFQLQQVDRKMKHWELIYGAWEDHGSARQVAEIRVVIGRLGTFSHSLGVAAFIRCFAPSIRSEKPLRGKLKDSARLILRVSDLEKKAPRWEVPAPSTKCSLEIVGSDPCQSHRAQVGLGDEAYRALKAHKPNKSFIPKIQSRNNLIGYHPLWKTWPGTIVISGDSSGRVNGTYHKQECQQTIAHSALWRRDSTEDKPSMYIYIRPDVVRAGLDVAVISPTPSYHDGMEICELRDWIPENALKASTHKTKATFLEWEHCPESLKVELPAPTMVMTTQPEPFHTKVCARNADSPDPILCELSGLSNEVSNSLLGCNEDVTVAKLDLHGRSASRNAKRLSIVAAPSLLKYAAKDQLPLSLSHWYRLPSSSSFGHCKINVPPRPVEIWKEIPGKTVSFERIYDAEESNEYFQRLQNRPKAFEVSVQKAQGKLVVRMNPSVAAHHAAARLGGERTGSPEIDYCLAELSSMGEPETKEFHVPNSDAYTETTIDGLQLPLYHRQAKALTRMLAIEAGDVDFSEEERSEHILPGIGWCLIARAAKKSPLRGGVLGDAIGSGKTVVTIALILAGASKARANRDAKAAKSGATLIVVPPGLVSQWDDERKKFTIDKLKCIIIDSTATLKKISVKEMCNADMVIVPAGILEEEKGKSRPYTEHLSKKAGAGHIPPAPIHYSQREAPTIEGTWVRNMASGPEMYVGNKGNQKTRDAQAYYGHCYSEAIAKLRQKTFDPSDRGIPIEYFTWERVVIDECHETLVTGKGHETKDADFKDKARRGAREFLGVAQTDITKRPLVARAGVWGLTGTPLLETEARVTELANLMGGTYVTGASNHWRKEERESRRDMFLNQQEGTRSREYRCAVQEACHRYVREACQRNRGEQLQVELFRKQREVNMSVAEGEKFLKETSDFQSEGFAINPDQLGDKAGAVLSLTASSKARHAALVETIESIHSDEPTTKVIIFANTSYGGYDSARAALEGSGKTFCHISETSSVLEQNEIISWFRHTDATEEDRARPRILLLSFAQAAGHNLQEACHNLIIYDPMYSGTDAVADASVEEQAVGRVMRQGQKHDVTVTRIVVKGPNGERCLDDWIVERNLNDDVLRAATSNFD